jgi:sugar (pentulose or hexulose) kinase
MNTSEITTAIETGNTALGIEFGSTRIKAVLIDSTFSPIASGGHEWENRYENEMWTYRQDDIWAGLQACYQDLCQEVFDKYAIQLNMVGSIGFSGMMHGYLAFDQDDNLLVPFRTWRNTTTGQASGELMKLFEFNIPQRWSIAHLYQAILSGETHVREIKYLTTLAGYVHWKMTGQKVVGIGEASGMFPIDSLTNDYDARMLMLFNEKLIQTKIPWKLEDVLPAVLSAGDDAGFLTEEGAKLLDPSGVLESGIPLCPPEGDAVQVW